VKLPTASSLHRALACPASAVLPRAPSTTSEAAERGTAIHAYLEEWAQRGARPVAPPEYADTCHGIDLPAILAGRTICEVEAAYAFDVATGRARLIGYSLGRDYGPLSPTEIVGTADLVLIDSEGRGVILDWKTGQPQASAAVNPQLALLALCLSRYRGDPEVVVELVYLGEEGGHKVDRAVLDSLDLDSFAAQLREAVALWRSPEAAQRVNPGEWCKYCDSKRVCPAWTSLAREFAAGPSLTPGAIAALAPADVGRVIPKIRAYRKLLDEIEAQVNDYTRHHGAVPLENGNRYGWQEVEDSTLLPEQTLAVVAERFGDELAREMVKPAKVTKKALEGALDTVAKQRREAGEKVSKAALVRETLAEIDKRGGVRRTVHSEPREMKGGACE
jgi:hypothetical protein